jgi:hypothetical protein
VIVIVEADELRFVKMHQGRVGEAEPDRACERPACHDGQRYHHRCQEPHGGSRAACEEFVFDLGFGHGVLHSIRHSRESGNLAEFKEIPAFAGMTDRCESGLQAIEWETACRPTGID